ncbi:MAG: hypothetical protein ACREN4_06460 [Candidatus Dormibacteria bacterium]
MSSSTTDTAAKVRENRLRRMAERQGLQLVKSRRRDPRALDYGLFWLTSRNSNRIVLGWEAGGRGVTLDAVETYLSGEGSR